LYFYYGDTYWFGLESLLKSNQKDTRIQDLGNNEPSNNRLKLTAHLENFVSARSLA